MPIIKKELTPIQFFNKLPVDIIGQNKITSAVIPIKLNKLNFLL